MISTSPYNTSSFSITEDREKSNNKIDKRLTKVMKTINSDNKQLAILIADIITHLTKANPMKTNPIEGEAIILIDKQALSLDLAKQSDLLEIFSQTFPKSQFIILKK